MEKNLDLAGQHRELLPKGIRQHVYSYLPLNTIIHKISKLSRADRKMLVTSEIIDQPRALKIMFRDNLVYDIQSLKFMMKLLKNKWDHSNKRKNRNKLSLEGTERKPNRASANSVKKVRSINSSSPVLEDNVLNRLLDTNSEENENHIFEADFNQLTISDNESMQPQHLEDDDLSEASKTWLKQKKADVLLQIECENPAMIPFVRYVLSKAQKYGLDVHILLECIKNSTES